MGVMIAVLGVLVVWLTLLTASFLRWQGDRGEPVYRRLPDGRLRFEWSVGTAYQAARHARADALRSGRDYDIEPATPAARGDAAP